MSAPKPVFQSSFQGEMNLIRQDLELFRAEIRAELKAQTSEMIKWMFIFWIGQLGATTAVIMLFLKK